VVEAIGERRILPGFCRGHFQLGQGRHQGFGHVLAAEATEAAGGRGAHLGLQRLGIGERGGSGAGHRRRCIGVMPG
jgi:hypothetical protein